MSCLRQPHAIETAGILSRANCRDVYRTQPTFTSTRRHVADGSAAMSLRWPTAHDVYANAFSIYTKPVRLIRVDTQRTYQSSKPYISDLRHRLAQSWQSSYTDLSDSCIPDPASFVCQRLNGTRKRPHESVTRQWLSKNVPMLTMLPSGFDSKLSKRARRWMGPFHEATAPSLRSAILIHRLYRQTHLEALVSILSMAACLSWTTSSGQNDRVGDTPSEITTNA